MLCVNVGCTQSDDVTLVICIVCKCAAIVSSAVLLIVNTKYVRGLGTVAAVATVFVVCFCLSGMRCDFILDDSPTRLVCYRFACDTPLLNKLECYRLNGRG